MLFMTLVGILAFGAFMLVHSAFVSDRKDAIRVRSQPSHFDPSLLRKERLK